MKPTGINNLTAEDAAVILELSPILDIAFVKAIGQSEKKFYIETTQGEKWLLRITPMNEYKWVKNSVREYEYIATVGANVSRQVSEGFLREKTLVYHLWTWIDGEDIMTALPRMSPAEQFALGVKCGEVARKIHTLPPLDDPEPWWVRKKREEVQEKIESYAEKPNNRTRGEDLLIGYLQENIGLLDNRPETFIHGNWNTSNLMLSPDGQIWVIDFGITCGDPWCEFWEVSGDANEMPQYYTGLIKSYFGGEPPTEYFSLFAFYVAMSYLEWGYDPKNVLNWFDNMRNPVPNWYLKDFTLI